MTGMMMFGAFMKVFNDAEESGKDADQMVDSIEFWAVAGPQIFGAVALVFLVSTVLEVVRSGFKAVFVCFVQVIAFFCVLPACCCGVDTHRHPRFPLFLVSFCVACILFQKNSRLPGLGVFFART